MFADLLPPPTFVFDWYLLGWPGAIAFVAVILALITAFRIFAKRGVRMGWLVVAFVLSLLIANMVAYFVGVNLQRPQRDTRAISRGQGTE